MNHTALSNLALQIWEAFFRSFLNVNLHKDSITDMLGFTVYVKEGFPFARCLNDFTSLCLASFSSIDHLSSLCTVFDTFSSNIYEVLSINRSANVFVFGDSKVHRKDWLTYSDGTDRCGELCYSFSFSNDLTQMVNFPSQIPDCDSQSCSFGFIYFLWR